MYQQLVLFGWALWEGVLNQLTASAPNYRCLCTHIHTVPDLLRIGKPQLMTSILSLPCRSEVCLGLMGCGCQVPSGLRLGQQTGLILKAHILPRRPCKRPPAVWQDGACGADAAGFRTAQDNPDPLSHLQPWSGIFLLFSSGLGFPEEGPWIRPLRQGQEGAGGGAHMSECVDTVELWEAREGSVQGAGDSTAGQAALCGGSRAGLTGQTGPPAASHPLTHRAWSQGRKGHW